MIIGYSISTKGKALLFAVDSGLIKKSRFGKMDIAPFLRFWDKLEPILEEAGYKPDDCADMLKEEGDGGAEEK